MTDHFFGPIESVISKFTCSSGHGVVWPGGEPRIEPRTGEKFSFNVDIHVVAATFIHISQLI